MNNVTLAEKMIVLCGAFLFALMIAVNSFCVNDSPGFRVPMTTYLIVMIALFFLDTIIFIFIQMQYASDRSHPSLLILSLAFLSGLVYFIETIVIIQLPENAGFSYAVKTNDTAVFYFFRQLSLIFLLALAVWVEKLSTRSVLGRRNKAKLALALFIPLVVFPVLAHYMSSYHPALSLTIASDGRDRHDPVWNVSYVNVLIAFWSFLLCYMTYVTRLSSGIWNSIIVVCLSAIIYNFFLLLLDTYNMSLWYISRTVEVFSKLFVICTLLFHVFSMLKIFGDRVNRDPLTQIFNRKYFYEALQRIRTLRTEKGASIMMLDIDNFKSINDTWGHPAGDRVLLAVVDIIKDSIRDKDIFARLGGEEFGLLLPDTDANLALSVAERIRQNVQRRTGQGNHYAIPAEVTLSIGVCSAIQNSLNSNDVIRNVDDALYEAKHNGKNRTVTRQAECS
ncbi:GGDEF domain-containing protein [Enterobacter cloacae complex sp. P40RS]|uniref:diguanylate cyclase n=2 Tax=Enterobacter TaxID=547 RepID=A0ABR9QAL1_9ENTR|nr:GGDEF domain-containing protein [Enterobacter pasteurii]MBE4864945.1 GGDEF domain-containing protein [Enterobacter cloacae complex sp. P40C2]MBE4876031.1 GGDEF domain-containing protein [Enterobacter cloacae complex sp. P40C]